MTRYEGCVVAGGHSPFTEKNLPFDEEQYGNFNVLLYYPKTYDYNEMLERFKAVSKHSLLVQTLDDFRNNKVSEPTVNPNYGRIGQMQVGNIRDTIQDEYFSHEFLSFIDSLNQVFPGIAEGSNMLYGPSVEWCMDTVDVSEDMETDLPNLFAVGDGAGLSQGIVYSASTGIIAVLASSWFTVAVKASQRGLLLKRKLILDLGMLHLMLIGQFVQTEQRYNMGLEGMPIFIRYTDCILA